MPNGRVIYNNEESKTRLQKFCEKKIDKWLKDHQIETLSHAEFRVEFNDEEGSQQISCMTEIWLEGGCTWRGCDLSDDTQQAFIHSLKRLAPH